VVGKAGPERLVTDITISTALLRRVIYCGSITQSIKLCLFYPLQGVVGSFNQLPPAMLTTSLKSSLNLKKDYILNLIAP